MVYILSFSAFPVPLPRLLEAVQSKKSTCWPDYSSPEWISYMSDVMSSITFELDVKVDELKWQCFFDHFFNPESNVDGISNSAEQLCSEITFLSKDINFGMKCSEDGLLRCFMSSSYLEIKDEKEAKPEASVYFRAGPRPEEEINVEETDLFTWGLRCGRHTLTTKLPFAFQFSLFMTPHQWCSINVGFDPVEGRLKDLSPLWSLYEYFGSYFRFPEFGHPFFIIEKKTLGKTQVNDVKLESSESEDTCMNWDIRLWFNRLALSIPSINAQSGHPTLLLKTTDGVFYHYKSIGYKFSDQEFCCKDLSLMWAREFFSKEPFTDSIASDQHTVIVDGLRLFASYSFNHICNHTHISMRLPLCDEDYIEKDRLSGIETESVAIHPIIMKRPLILGVTYTPTLNLGANICTLMISQRNLLNTYEALLHFSGIRPLIPAPMDNSNEHQIKEGSKTILMNIGGIRAVLCDPVLGTHLPLASFSFATLEVQLVDFHRRTSEGSNIQIGANFEFWAEYFCNTIRMFEPLIEPYKALCLYEITPDRGPNFIFQSDSSFHFNVTGASLDVLDQAMQVFVDSTTAENKGDETEMIRSTNAHEFLGDGREDEAKDLFFEENDAFTLSNAEFVRKVPRKLFLDERVAYSLTNLTGQQIRVSQPEKERCFQISYLNHNECMELTFNATYCIFQNLTVQEIPFESYVRQSSGSAMKSCGNVHHVIGVQVPGFEWVEHIMVDSDVFDTFQNINGFQLVSCPRFHTITPLSSNVRSKVELDWRLSNALKLVSEVSFLNGGRRMVISSPFKIINKCSHSIVLVLHPSPYDEVPIVPDAEKFPKSYAWPKSHLVDNIAPNETYHVPLSLLEYSLSSTGNHLGSFWICPEPKSDDAKKCLSSMVQFYGSTVNASECLLGFCSTAVQLSKVVQESSVQYDKTCIGIKDGIESRRILVSCPVIHNQKTVSSPPFFYVIEVKRSPFLSSTTRKSSNPSLDYADSFAPNCSQSPAEGYLSRTDSNLIPPNTSFDSECFRSGVEQPVVRKRKKKGYGTNLQTSSGTHSPIDYSLIIHPPIVLENILPCGGTFELMHLNRRQVIWREYLDPGQIAPIYCVGLDTPLLLLLNLGYCRTPHGQGALIHDGIVGDDGIVCKLLKSRHSL